MIDVYLLEANEGDCLFIHFGNDQEKYNIIIDGGTETCGNTVKNIIEYCDRNDEMIDLILITHVDEDHICGIITGFSAMDEKVLQNRIQSIGFNTSQGFQSNNEFDLKKTNKPEDAVKTVISEGDGCSIGDAKSLCDILIEKKLIDKVDNYIIAGTKKIIGGAKLTFISPNKQSLRNFMNNWEDENDGESEKGCSGGFPGELYVDLAELMDSRLPGADGSLSNRASIAFLFEYEDTRMLFLGDAAAPIYTKELRKLMKDDRIAIDVVKLSHHGSSRSLSKAFLNIINSDVFLISSNGTTLKGQYTVPGKIAIAKLLKGKQKVTLLNNYCWWEEAYQNQYFTENDVDKYIDTKILELVKVSDEPYNVKEGLSIYGEFKAKEIIS